MTQSVFDRETLLDLTVNAIPLAILLFFIVVFAVMNPFGPATVVQAIQFSIVGVMFVALAILTYYSGKAVAGAEQKMEREEAPEPEGKLEAGDDQSDEAVDAGDEPAESEE